MPPLTRTLILRLAELLMSVNLSYEKSYFGPEPWRPLSLLLGLPKVHKNNVPLRLVSCIHSPTYRLAEFLGRWFKLNVEFQSPRSDKNSLSQIEKIKDCNPASGSRLVSFDVAGLFSSIPKFPLHSLRVSSWWNLMSLIMTSLKFLTNCWSLNFCQFNNKICMFYEKIGIAICFFLFLKASHSPLDHIVHWYF